jgi:pimeloyl-ACP methyl ester carboxylesterase
VPAFPFESSAADGTRLRGELWPGGPDWVVMAHDYGEDLDSWRPLIGPLLAARYTVATVDLRGHGTSEGSPERATISQDVAAALALARRHSASSVALLAAGVTAAACLSPDIGSPPDCLVLFSPRPESMRTSELRGEGASKLFLVGATDLEADRSARELRGRSIGVAGVVSFPTEIQGTSLLEGPWREHVIEQVVGFVEQVRFSSIPTSPEGGTT